MSRKKQEEKTKGLYLTESQHAALVQLDNFAGVFRLGANQRFGGIAPRTKVLLLGGTGAGKTSVARRFARNHGWAFLSQDASGWIPAGAYAAQSRPATLVAIRDFVRRVPKGVICIDEVDKLLPSTSATRESGYSTAIFAEALAFMDQDERLVGHLWSDSDIQKLKCCFFIIAAGAFQSFLADAEKKARGGNLGFGTPEERSTDFGKFLSEANALPDEIASRFATPPIFIGQPSQADFEVAIKQIHQDLGVELQRPLEDLLAQAVGYVGGVRWLENYVTQLLIAHPESARPTEIEVQPEHEDESTGDRQTYDFFAIDTVEHVRQLNDDVFSLRTALAHVVGKLHLAAAENCFVEPREKGFWKYLYDYGSLLKHTALAISACKLCGDVSSDTTHLAPLREWEQRAWEGIQEHATDLESLGLLAHWMEAWNLCSRVIQRQAHLSNQVAMGRYQK